LFGIFGGIVSPNPSEIKNNSIKWDNLVTDFKEETYQIEYNGCVEAISGQLKIKAGNKSYEFTVCKPDLS